MNPYNTNIYKNWQSADGEHDDKPWTFGVPNCEITSIPNSNPSKPKLIQAATLRVVHTKARQTLGCLAACSVRTPKRWKKTVMTWDPITGLIRQTQLTWMNNSTVST